MSTILTNELSIFLVDDQYITNFINKKLIEVTGMCKSVYDFTDPVEALEHLEQILPYLILLDLNMPEIDGWDFLEKMEGFNTIADVVIVTSSTSILDKEKAKNYDRVKGFFVKPLNNKTVLSIISKYK